MRAVFSKKIQKERKMKEFRVKKKAGKKKKKKKKKKKNAKNVAVRSPRRGD
jgi:hypothetical protein